MKKTKKTVTPMRRMRKITIEKIKALSKKGMSQRKIAREVGYSRSAVYYHLKK